MTEAPKRAFDYSKAGDDTEKAEAGRRLLIMQLERTLENRPADSLGHVRLPFGYFANVIKLTAETGLAISTDGVGSKVLVAQMVGRYDTIGIDCIAMNVNDLLCVGAEPLTMVDYLAVERLNPDHLAQIAKGLADGALQARITIPAGEIAQMRDIIRGAKGARGAGFDLAGTAVGTVPLDRVIIGQRVEPDDVVIGIR